MNSVKVSVVITTMNRPVEFEVALTSVLSQDYDNFEVIVVIDGGTSSIEQYRDIMLAYAERVAFYPLGDRKRGHGPSFARNVGIEHCFGDYIGFLDDDDVWTDTHHLTKFIAHNVKSNYNSDELDIYFSHQRAILPNGNVTHKAIWIEDLIDNVFSESVETKEVDVTTLLKSKGFPHLNCVLINQNLANKIGGFDESLRYEEDRDFYYRAIDLAERISLSPHFIGKHYIPHKRDSASSAHSIQQKLHQQLQSAIKLQSTISNKLIVKRIKHSASHTCIAMSEQLIKMNEYPAAYTFIKMSMAFKFSFGAVKALFKILNRTSGSNGQ